MEQYTKSRDVQLHYKGLLFNHEGFRKKENRGVATVKEIMSENFSQYMKYKFQI